MSAQEKWKSRYDRFKAAKGMGLFGNAEDWRNDMYLIRREAALERKCEALTRQVAKLNGAVEALDDIITCAQYAGGKYTISGELFDEVVLTREAAS